MSNKQTRGGASIKLAPLDSPNHGAYSQNNFGPLDPYRFFVGYIYLFSWHVIGIFNSLWFVIDIFNCSWSVNRQLAVNCDCIVLFPVNGDCLSENPVNCDPNITRDTWFSLLSVKYLGVVEIYIRWIAQNVPILMIFSQIFRGACPRTPLH